MYEKKNPVLSYRLYATAHSLSSHHAFRTIFIENNGTCETTIMHFSSQQIIAVVFLAMTSFMLHASITEGYDQNYLPLRGKEFSNFVSA